MPPTTPLPTTFEVDGAALRAARMHAGHSMRDFAAKVDIDRSYLSSIETGRRPRVSPQVFARIVEALGVERDALLVKTSEGLAS